MDAQKVKIDNAIQPAKPTERVVAEVSLRYDGELKCFSAKIEYGEITGPETVGWRSILTGADAELFAAGWAMDPDAAVENILKKGDLRSERH